MQCKTSTVAQADMLHHYYEFTQSHISHPQPHLLGHNSIPPKMCNILV